MYEFNFSKCLSICVCFRSIAYRVGNVVSNGLKWEMSVIDRANELSDRLFPYLNACIEVSRPERSTASVVPSYNVIHNQSMSNIFVTKTEANHKQRASNSQSSCRKRRSTRISCVPGQQGETHERSERVDQRTLQRA
jgi:hypothetical protein